jgi:hypothetical protein
MGQPAARRDDSVAAILSSILVDVERLLRQEITLARREVGVQVRDAGNVGVWFVGGAVLLAFAFALLLLMLSGLLVDAFGWRPWMGHGAVGATLVVAGGVALLAARRRMRAAGVEPGH